LVNKSIGLNVMSTANCIYYFMPW